MADENLFDRLEQKKQRLKAQSILFKDDINQGNIEMDSALAEFIANTPDATKHKESYGEMTLVGKALEGLSGGLYENVVDYDQSRVENALENLDVAMQSAKGSNGGSDVEEAFADAAEADPEFHKRNIAARFAELESEVADFAESHNKSFGFERPEVLQRIQEKTKDLGFWEGMGVAASEFHKGDVLGNYVYLMSNTLGRQSPAIALGGLNSVGLGVFGKMPTTARLINAAAMGAFSANATYSSELRSRLLEKGFDLSDPKEWVRALEQGAELEDARRAARGKGLVVGAVDAFSMHAASMTLNVGDMWRKIARMKKYNPNKAGIGSRIAHELDSVATGAAVQGAMGGAGEALGSLAIGETPNAGDVFLEIVGELGSGLTEMGTQSLATVNQFRRDQDAAEQARIENKAHQQITEAANAIGQRIGENEAVDAWAQRVGQNREFHAFAQDLVTNGQVELIAEVKPELAEKIVQAAEEGGTVTISAGDIISIATKDKALADNILEDCRSDIAGMSPRQAEDFVKNGQKEADQLFEKTAKKYKATVEQAKAAHRVGQRIKQELIDAGTRQDIAAAQVKPLEMYLVRLAGQLGIDPEVAVSEMGLHVVRNGSGSNVLAKGGPRKRDSGEGFFSQPRVKPAPTKTVKAYKLFRVKKSEPGKLFPLFVDANTPVPMGVWEDAIEGEQNDKGKVKSRIGALHYRPGWHAGDLPLATHIGSKSSPDIKAPDLRSEDQVWAEVEFAADVDYQPEANANGINEKGKFIAGNAEINHLPVDGFYRYKTNPNMTGQWLIGGSMKVNRILSDEEVAAINAEAGLADLPRAKPFDRALYGFDEGGYPITNGTFAQSAFSSADAVRAKYKDTDQWLKAPNGEQSNLNELEWCLVRTPEFKAWFGDWENDPENASKVVDENGEPLAVYHGTTAGRFEIFDNQFANLESDMGKAFYFTSSRSDVENNYEGGGPDFDLKVESLAQRLIDEDESITDDEAMAQARAQLFKGSYLFTVFLNIRNPAYVADTKVLTGESARQKAEEDIDRDDYDDEDEYEQDVWNAIEENVQEEVEAILGAVEYEGFDVDRNELAAVLYDAIANEGITIPELKKRIGDLYPGDENGNLADNEITRLALEMLGYDGIIDSTVGEKFKNMKGLKKGDVHYLAFKPNQIKSVENSGAFDSRNPNMFYQTAYNGGPTKHTKFDMSKVGSGLGTRMFGWGMYFSDKKHISEKYRNAALRANDMSYHAITYNGEPVENRKNLIERVFFHGLSLYLEGNPEVTGDLSPAEIKKAGEFMAEISPPDSADDILAFASSLAETIEDYGDVVHAERNGRVFAVDIPENDQLLDWDKSIYEQPEAVKAALKRLADDANKTLDESYVDSLVERVKESPTFQSLLLRGKLGSAYASERIVRNFIERLIRNEFVTIDQAVMEYGEQALATNGSTITSDDQGRIDYSNEDKPVTGWYDIVKSEQPANESVEEDSQELFYSTLEGMLRRIENRLSMDAPLFFKAEATGEDIYRQLERYHVGQKEQDKLASLKLNEYGIPGLTYRDHGNFTGGDQRGFVIFNNDAIQILDFWQGEGDRGGYTPSTTSTNTGSYAGTIELMEKADESTFLHESSHFFLDMDMAMAKRLSDKFASGESLTDGEKEFLTNLGGFLKWGQDEGVINLGVDDSVESVMRAAQAWANLSMDEQRAMHELFANGFEAYLMTGTAPNNAVRSIFSRFKEWLMDVYATATRKPRPISKEVQKLYSLMFATEQEVAEVEAANSMLPLFELEDQREEEEAKRKGVKLTKEQRREYRKLHKEVQLEANGIVMKAVAGVMNYYVKLKESAAKKIIKENKQRVEKRIDELLEQPRYVAYSILTDGLMRDGKKLRFKLAPESLRAEGYSEETIQALADKGLVYGRNNPKKQLSPNRLAEMAGADDAVQLVKDLAEGTKAKARSPLARARDLLGWSGGYKLSVRELKAAGVDDATIAKLIERDIAYDSSLRSDTTNSVALAEMAGHDSPVDLIAELVDIQEPRIEAASQIAAEIQMETGETPERYTELQANLAAHTKARSRLLHVEYNAIAEMLGQRQLAIYAAREYAKKKLEGVRLGDINANAYIAAERRCARDAERAFVKGDFQACLDAKRGQILNHELARLALEVEDKLVKAKRAAKRAMKSKGLYKPYQRLLARLVAAHNLEKVPSKLERTLGTQDNAAAELVEEGYYAQSTPDNLNPIDSALANNVDIKDMTLADARTYLETVNELTAIARNRLKQNLIETAERIDEIVERGIEELDKAVAEQGVDKPVNETAKSTWGKRLQGWKGFFFDHVKAQTLCRIFDRDQDNGFFWNLFIRSANDRAAFENEERAKVTQKLDEILTPIFGSKSAYTQDKQRIGNKLMSKGERFAAACNMGNASNLQRLRDGDPKQWTSENIEALQNSLTAEEWLAVQAVWDLLESFRPQIAEKQMRVYGEEPQWIEPQELTVQTADGEVLTLRGGYYPVKYDPRAGAKAGGFDAAKDAEAMMKGSFQSQTTSRSFIKERVKNPNMGPLLLDMSGLFTGLDDVIHDLAWHEWLIETGRVLRGAHGRDTGLDAAIRERYGDDQAKLLNNWRTNIAVGDRIEGDVLSSLVRGRAGISLMGWSATSALVQLTGIGYVIPRCGVANTMKALKHVLKNPLKARRDINEVSSVMKLRGLTANKTIAEIRNRIQDGKAPWWKEHALSMLLAVQSLVDTICWYAAYGKALQDEKVLNDINPDATAIAVADQSVSDTQGSGNVHEMSNIENNANKQLWTVFYSWASTALNQTLAIYKGENDRKSAWAKLFWMGVIMPTVEKLFRDALQAEDEDEDDELDPMKMLRMPLGASVEYHLGLFVYARELANVAGAKVSGEHAYGYGGPAGTRGIAVLNQAIANAGGSEEDGLFTWSTLSTGINVAGALTGIPSAQVNRTIKGIRAIESGQAEGIDALLAPVFGFSGRIKD